MLDAHHTIATALKELSLYATIFDWPHSIQDLLQHVDIYTKYENKQESNMYRINNKKKIITIENYFPCIFLI